MDFGSWDWVGNEEKPTFDIQSLFHSRRLEEVHAPKNESSGEQCDPKMRLQWGRCVSRFAALRAEISNCWDDHEETTHILHKMRKELHEHTRSLAALQPASDIDPIPIGDDSMCKSNSHVEAFEELNRALQSGDLSWLNSAILLCRNVKIHENKLQPALKRLDKWESVRDGRSETFVSLPENVEDNGKAARARSGLRRAMASRDWKIVKKALQDAECLLCSDEKIMIAAREELSVLEERKDASNSIQRALKSRNADELKEAINLCVWSDCDDGIIAKARAALQTEMSQVAAREKLQKAMASDNIEVLQTTVEETSNHLLDDAENELGEARKRLAILKATKTLREAARLGDVSTFVRAIDHAAKTGVGAIEINRAQTELSRLRVHSLLDSEDPTKIRTALKRLDSSDSVVVALHNRLTLLERKRKISAATQSGDFATIKSALDSARHDQDYEGVVAAETALERIKTTMADDLRDAMEAGDIEKLKALVVETEPVLRHYPVFHSAKAQLAGHENTSVFAPEQEASLVDSDGQEMPMTQVARQVSQARNLLFEDEKMEATDSLQAAIARGSVADLEHALAEGEDKMVDEEYIADGVRVLQDRSAYTAAATFNASFSSEMDSPAKVPASVRSLSIAKSMPSLSARMGKEVTHFLPDRFEAGDMVETQPSSFSMPFGFFPPFDPAPEVADTQEARASVGPDRMSVVEGEVSGKAKERARARIEAKDAIAKAANNADYEDLEVALEHGREAGLTTRELEDGTKALEDFRAKVVANKRAADALSLLTEEHRMLPLVREPRSSMLKEATSPEGDNVARRDAEVEVEPRDGTAVIREFPSISISSAAGVISQFPSILPSAQAQQPVDPFAPRLHSADRSEPASPTNCSLFDGGSPSATAPCTLSSETTAQRKILGDGVSIDLGADQAESAPFAIPRATSVRHVVDAAKLPAAATDAPGSPIRSRSGCSNRSVSWAGDARADLSATTPTQQVEPVAMHPSSSSTAHSPAVLRRSEGLVLEKDEALRTLQSTMRESHISEVALNTALMVARKLELDKTDQGLRDIAEAEEVLTKCKLKKLFLDIVYSKNKDAITLALKTAPTRELAMQAEAMLENLEQEEIQKALDEVEEEDAALEQGSAPTAVEVGPNQWQCAACSFVNDDPAHACAICLTQNPAAPQTPQPQQRSASDNPWECPQCTFQNAASRRRCEICGTNNPSGPARAQSAPASVEPWTCPVCTMGENTTAVCATCQTPNANVRSSAPPRASPAFNPNADPSVLQRVQWGASLRPGDHVKAKTKMKWAPNGEQISVSQTGSFFKVSPGMLGTYVGVWNGKIMVEWAKGRSVFMAAVEPSAIQKL